MKTSKNRSRRRLPAALVLSAALLGTGASYATLTPGVADAADSQAAGDVEKGRKLYQTSCMSCHGPSGVGRQSLKEDDPGVPSLIGVGAAAVDFQVGTGRMPMRATGAQAPRNMPVFDDAQVNDLAAYIASLGPGPSVPKQKYLDPVTDAKALTEGGEIFRINCAMCHNVVGSGGALTRGKYAPKLTGVDPKHIYEAMSTGPQSMPVFNDANISPEDKQKVISYIVHVNSKPKPGGLSLGSLGPVSEGLFVWVAGLTMMIGCAVWLGMKSA